MRRCDSCHLSQKNRKVYLNLFSHMITVEEAAALLLQTQHELAKKQARCTKLTKEHTRRKKSPNLTMEEALKYAAALKVIEQDRIRESSKKRTNELRNTYQPMRTRRATISNPFVKKRTQRVESEYNLRSGTISHGK